MVIPAGFLEGFGGNYRVHARSNFDANRGDKIITTAAIFSVTLDDEFLSVANAVRNVTVVFVVDAAIRALCQNSHLHNHYSKNDAIRPHHASMPTQREGIESPVGLGSLLPSRLLLTAQLA